MAWLRTGTTCAVAVVDLDSVVAAGATVALLDAVRDAVGALPSALDAATGAAAGGSLEAETAAGTTGGDAVKAFAVLGTLRGAVAWLYAAPIAGVGPDAAVTLSKARAASPSPVAAAVAAELEAVLRRVTGAATGAADSAQVVAEPTAVAITRAVCFLRRCEVAQTAWFRQPVIGCLSAAVAPGAPDGHSRDLTSSAAALLGVARAACAASGISLRSATLVARSDSGASPTCSPATAHLVRLRQSEHLSGVSPAASGTATKSTLVVLCGHCMTARHAAQQGAACPRCANAQ